jgi:hypothetical protein
VFDDTRIASLFGASNEEIAETTVALDLALDAPSRRVAASILRELGATWFVYPRAAAAFETKMSSCLDDRFVTGSWAVAEVGALPCR